MRIAFFLLAIACFAEERTAEQLYGRWKVVAVTTAGPVTAIRGAEASQLVGQFLDLTPASLRFARQTCHPTYRSSAKALSEIAKAYKIDAKSLQLPDPVLSFDADCSEIFVQKPGIIIFAWEGYLFKATKASSHARY